MVYKINIRTKSYSYLLVSVIQYARGNFSIVCFFLKLEKIPGV